jgi:hypothetical protein
MSTNEEKCSGCSLVAEAHHQMELCCESACEKQPIKDYVQYLEERIELLENQIKELNNGRT